MCKVSICIPAYNDPDELNRLLTSVAEQTYSDYEVVITDDSDDDRISALISGSCPVDAARVRYHRNDRKLGHIYNWNAAISMAKGDYTKIMFSDDWFTSPDSLGKLVGLLDGDPGADLAFCGSMQVSESDSYERKLSDTFIPALKADWRTVFAGNEIGAPSDTIYRGNKILFDVHTNWASDVELYLHILSENPHFAYTAEPLVSIGIHEDQYTNQFSSGDSRIINDYKYIYKKYDLSTNGKCRKYMEDMTAQRSPTASVKSALTAGTGHIDPDQLGKLLFYIGLSLELFYEIWDKSAWQIGNDGTLFRISFVFLFMKVLLTRYTKREKLITAAFVILGLISYRCSSRNDVLRVVILCAACRGMDIKRMLKYTFSVTLAGCLALVTMALLGIAGDVTRTAAYRSDIPETRYVLGMGHPNALHCMFWALVTLGMLVYWEKLKWYHYLMLAAADCGLYMLTDSNTGFMMTMFAVILAAFLNIRKREIKGRIAGWAGIAGTAVIVSLSLLTAWYGWIYNDNGLWNEPHFVKIEAIDSRFFHGRLWNAYGYPDSHMGMFRLFSSPACTRHMDLGYYKLFYWYGYIPAAVYVAAVILLLWYAMKKKRYDLIMFVTAWSAYNFVEAHEISEYIGRNYLYLLMGAYWAVILKADTGEERRWWQF